MKKEILLILFSLLLFACTPPEKKEKTVFQTASVWKPTLDNRADVAIIYGVGGNPSDKENKSDFEARVKSWQEREYTTHFMTGIAWGGYADYFTGQWDGVQHFDEGQVNQNNDTIWHGHLVPYIVPSENYLNYLKEMHIRRVIDAGIDAIYLEEPEFWAHAGYSESFKREWKKYYGFDWRPQHESPENTYLSNKLKYHLYYRALENVFTYAKEYGKSKGMNVRCYVPTHSLINYSQWGLVSPEASLASMPCIDGYIAQVWTGTSRVFNYYDGISKERVFEAAYLEYGSMESMTAPTGRKMFFLTDPIEDAPKDWEDYKRNYEATFTAKLLYPNVADYEVMPWPERIYEGLYKTSADSDQMEKIPRHYSTQMQVMINALNDMPVSGNKLSGPEGISVLMANSMMFQCFPSHYGYDDPQLSNFFGLTLPLIKRGIPVKTVHIENLPFKETLKDTKVLLMTYSNIKPLDSIGHAYLADWVKAGGVLVYSSRDNDPFQKVQEWWNTGTKKYNAPSEHLFQLMNMKTTPESGEHPYGKGTVYVLRYDPKEYVLQQGGDREFLSIVQDMYENKAKAGKLTFKNNFYLQRGCYELIAVMDESINTTPYNIEGIFIDLFDPQLPVLTSKNIQPGQQAMLYNIKSIKNRKKPQVLASASRVANEKTEKREYSFIAKGPLNTTNVSRVLLPDQPHSVSVTGKNINVDSVLWDELSKTCLLTFENNPDGVEVLIKW